MFSDFFSLMLASKKVSPKPFAYCLLPCSFLITAFHSPGGEPDCGCFVFFLAVTLCLVFHSSS